MLNVKAGIFEQSRHLILREDYSNDQGSRTWDHVIPSIISWGGRPRRTPVTTAPKFEATDM